MRFNWVSTLKFVREMSRDAASIGQKIACGPACHRLLRFAEASFLRRQQLRSCLIQVGQGEQHMELCRIFPQSAVARHGMTPLALDHPERKLDDRPPARRSLYFRALA